MTEHTPDTFRAMLPVRFTSNETFGAVNAARRWLHSHGVSYGSMCRKQPIGLMVGDYAIAKWRNLSPSERAECDAYMVSDDFRDGAVLIVAEPRRHTYLAGLATVNPAPVIATVTRPGR